MMEGTLLGWGDIFRQNKPMYKRLCINLGIPEHGTRKDIILRLKTYVFSTSQMDELKQFKTTEFAACARDHERKKFDEMCAGPRPYDYGTHSALKLYEVNVSRQESM